MLTSYSSEIQHSDGMYTTETADIYLDGLFSVHVRQYSQCGKIQDLGIQRLEDMIFAFNCIASCIMKAWMCKCFLKKYNSKAFDLFFDLCGK